MELRVGVENDVENVVEVNNLEGNEEVESDCVISEDGCKYIEEVIEDAGPAGHERGGFEETEEEEQLCFLKHPL